MDAQKIEMRAHARATSYDSLYRLQNADALQASLLSRRRSAMALPSYLSILKVLVLLLALPVASSRKFDHYCETERTVVEVAFDRSTNAHVVVGGRRGGKRLLKHEEDNRGKKEKERGNDGKEYAIVKDAADDLMQQGKADNDNFLARRCLCGEDTFGTRGAVWCPVSNGDKCGVSWDENYVGCMTHSTLIELSRDYWPVAFVIIIIFVLSIGATRIGRGALGYVFSCCIPCINRRIADRMVRSEIERRDNSRRLTRAELRRQIRQDGYLEGYVLKTKTYFKKDENKDTFVENGNTALYTKTYSLSDDESNDFAGDDDSDDKAFPAYIGNEGFGSAGPQGIPHVSLDVSECFTVEEPSDDLNDVSGEDLCTICLLCFQDGDRVGDLPCGHNFHVECLKEWIRCRNTCPLCQVENIATERRRHTLDGDEGQADEGPLLVPARSSRPFGARPRSPPPPPPPRQPPRPTGYGP